MILSRYLYPIDEVKNAILISLVNKKYYSLEYLYYWVSEFYFSGFYKESWEFIIQISNDLYRFNERKLHNSILKYFSKCNFSDEKNIKLHYENIIKFYKNLWCKTYNTDILQMKLYYNHFKHYNHLNINVNCIHFGKYIHSDIYIDVYEHFIQKYKNNINATIFKTLSKYFVNILDSIQQFKHEYLSYMICKFGLEIMYNILFCYLDLINDFNRKKIIPIQKYFNHCKERNVNNLFYIIKIFNYDLHINNYMNDHDCDFIHTYFETNKKHLLIKLGSFEKEYIKYEYNKQQQVEELSNNNVAYKILPFVYKFKLPHDLLLFARDRKTTSLKYSCKNEKDVFLYYWISFISDTPFWREKLINYINHFDLINTNKLTIYDDSTIFKSDDILELFNDKYNYELDELPLKTQNFIFEYFSPDNYQQDNDKSIFTTFKNNIIYY